MPCTTYSYVLATQSKVEANAKNVYCQAKQMQKQETTNFTICGSIVTKKPLQKGSKCITIDTVDIQSCATPQDEPLHLERFGHKR